MSVEHAIFAAHPHRALPEAVWAWTDALHPLGPETIPLDSAARGRVLAAPMVAGAPLPPAAVAATDGYAVRADDTVGASAYGPVLLRLGRGEPIAPGEARAVVSGSVLPAGADAVLALEDGEAGPLGLQVRTAIAAGSQVIPAGLEVRAGEALARQGVLRPQDLARLRLVGVEEISAVRRPRVRLLSGSDPIVAPDADGLLLQALVARDGGLAEQGGCVGAEGLAEALRAPGADLVLVYGGSGEGGNDHATEVVRGLGALAFSGVALHPGESTALGEVLGVPVIMLPGWPLSCLSAYELVAARALRRLAGRTPGWPYGLRRARLRRKIASRLGRLELCRVRLSDDEAEPLGLTEAACLRTAVEADGFVLVDVDSEGFAPDTEVTVHVFP